MTWDINQPYKAESKKIVWEVAPYLRGRGLDIGAGTFKVLPHVISVDNGHHEIYGHHINPDVKVETAEDLSVFGSQSMDFVYSSHLLEHMERPQETLKEWFRLVRIKGYLVLYTPNDELYPKVGEEGANQDHKFNLNSHIIIEWMKKAGSWDLVECQKRDQDDEYSDLLIFQKLDGKQWKMGYAASKPDKTVLVCRFGAFGDLMMASSVLVGLKRQGYHVTLMCSRPACDVVSQDPNIDRFMILDKDQVPNANLGDFWRWQAKKYTKFVNLSESVEGTWLSLPGRTTHAWSPVVRHHYQNENYLEFQHRLAGVPHIPNVAFYPTEDEKKWARKQRDKMGLGPVVVWSLAGSSGHKTWAGLDHIIAGIMLNYPTTHVVLVGGPECMMLEAGWEKESRVHRTCGKWAIRQSLSFLSECDLVIGPETGVLNAASHMPVRKICFLSHSSWENLTRDWVNTVAVWSSKTKCPGRGYELDDNGENQVSACHQLHYGWEHCLRDENQGVAQCQADISVEEVWVQVEEQMEKLIKEVA